MLYWIWFSALSAIAWYVAFLSQKTDDADIGHPFLEVLSVFLGIGSIAIAYPVTLLIPFYFLVEFLPQTGELINDLTAVFICLVYAIFWAFLPFFTFEVFLTPKSSETDDEISTPKPDTQNDECHLTDQNA